MRTEPRILCLLTLTVAACAQDRDQSLSAMRRRWRPLLVFAPSLEDAGFVQQIKELRAHVLEIGERDILVIPVISGQPVSSELFPGLSVAALPAREVTESMGRFHVGPGSFHVVLLGKDGSPKLSSKVPVAVRDLNRLIDSMPMRKREIKQKNAGT